MLNLNDLAEQAYTIADMRGQKTEVFSALKHCSGEVAEAIEANFLYNDYRTTNAKAELALELADIIICVLTASYEAEINIEEALSEAMQKNARRAYCEKS